MRSLLLSLVALAMLAGLASIHANAATALPGLKNGPGTSVVQVDNRNHHRRHRRWDHGHWRYWY